MIDVICERDEEGHAIVNIPQLVINGSPDGFEWGYSGSGPADLALNILEIALHSIHYSGPRDKCWKGSCFNRAFRWRTDFKNKFIAPMPKEGGVIKGSDILKWLSEHE